MHKLESKQSQKKPFCSERSEPEINTGLNTHQMKRTINKLEEENKQLKLTLTGKIRMPAEPPIVYNTKNSYELQEEKNAIEESLRGEMLLNEEQRNYIEILKEALSAKLDELGLKELLDDSSKDSFARLVVMKNSLERERNEINIQKEHTLELEKMVDELQKQVGEQKIRFVNINNECYKLNKEKEEAAKVLEEFTQKVFIL